MMNGFRLQKRSPFFLLLLLFTTALTGCSGFPSEKSLLKLFNDKRTELENLIAKTEGTTYILDNREVLAKELGVRSIQIWDLEGGKKGFVFYIGQPRLLGVMSTSSRGIGYLPSIPSNVLARTVPSLEKEKIHSTQVSYYLLQPIEGNWYLVEEVEG